MPVVFPLLPEPCPYRPIADAQGFRDLFQGPALRPHLLNAFPIHDPHWAAKLFAVCSRIPNSGANPFPDQVTLKLGDSRYNCEKRLPQRAARICVLLIADELNA